jgi:Uma2 family endonuclease
MTVSTLNRSYDAFNLYDRDIDDDEFFALCQRNPNFKLEKNPDGTVIIMPNTGGNTGKRNTKLTARLSFWEEENGGNTFDSSTAFIFPNGATRSPDAAWVSDELWNTLTDEEKDKFPRLTPEFVIELMSPSDKLRDAKLKMLEYIENGVQLAWLINPSEEEAHIFRADGTISKLNGFNNVLSGEDVLKGFVFDLSLLR